MIPGSEYNHVLLLWNLLFLPVFFGFNKKTQLIKSQPFREELSPIWQIRPNPDLFQNFSDLYPPHVTYSDWRMKITCEHNSLLIATHGYLGALALQLMAGSGSPCEAGEEQRSAWSALGTFFNLRH